MKILNLTALAFIAACPFVGLAQTTNIDTTPSVHTRHLPEPGQFPKLPSLILIGDSTVRNGQDTGTGGQWGWGDFLAPFFDTNRLNVANRALGGTSSRIRLSRPMAARAGAAEVRRFCHHAIWPQ